MAAKQGGVRLVQVITAPTSAWRLLDGQLAYMQQHGFHVTLVSAPGELLDISASREGVEAIGLPMLREPAPGKDAVALARLVNLFRRLDPHIVHVSTPKAGLLGGLASMIARVPVRLYTLRGIRAEGFSGLHGRAFTALERLTCLAAQRVYCVSPSVRARALALNLAPAEKLTVLGSGSSNGVNTTRFSRTVKLLARAEELRHRIKLPANVPVVGFVGRIARDKGIVELVGAYRLLRREFPQLHLMIVGRYETYDAIPAEVRRDLEGDPQVVTTGFLEDTAPAYPLMNVLAFPTYREGFGNVGIEAGAMEVPVVGTRVTGCADSVADGMTGTLVEARDAHALATALATYLRNPALCRQHGLAGRARAVREFQPERIWEAQYHEYVRLLREKRLPVPKNEPEDGRARQSCAAA
ncbi:MAG: glycosyltransferase family 4 protein [Pirellulales bacterium]